MASGSPYKEYVELEKGRGWRITDTVLTDAIIDEFACREYRYSAGEALYASLRYLRETKSEIPHAPKIFHECLSVILSDGEHQRKTAAHIIVMVR